MQKLHWYLYKKSRALPGPGLWEGGGGARAGGPARKNRKRYNLKRYAIITWDIMQNLLDSYFKTRRISTPCHV